MPYICSTALPLKYTCSRSLSWLPPKISFMGSTVSFSGCASTTFWYILSKTLGGDRLYVYGLAAGSNFSLKKDNLYLSTIRLYSFLWWGERVRTPLTISDFPNTKSYGQYKYYSSRSLKSRVEIILFFSFFFFFAECFQPRRIRAPIHQRFWLQWTKIPYLVLEQKEGSTTRPSLFCAVSKIHGCWPLVQWDLRDDFWNT